MEFHVIVIFVLVCIADSLSYSPEVIPRNENARLKNIPAVDALITRLEQEQWTADEEPCFRNTLDMLWGVKNNTLWATWTWDSMQPPVGSFYGTSFNMGNYDQCLKAPWSSPGDLAVYPALQTQYCVVDVRGDAVEEPRRLGPFDTVDEYYRTPTEHYRTFNNLSYGVCLSAACSPSTVTRIARYMHRLTHLPGGDVSLDPRDCRKAGAAVEFSRGFYVFWTLIGLLVATAAYSTYFKHEDSSLTTFADTITKSFCLRRNYTALFRVNGDEIKVMNGMRFMTSTLLVLVHEGLYTILSPHVNGLRIDETNTLHTLATMHLDLLVDTFFTMSGLLLVRGLMLGKQTNVFYTLVKRYIRLVGPLAICILYITTKPVCFYEGPFWSKSTREELDVCLVHWWKTILMANTNVETICHIVTWYVACDFQLAILATFLFCLCKKNTRIGVIALIAAFTGLTLHLAWMVYQYELDILPLGIKSIFKQRNNLALNHIYLKSYSRAGPYLVGMIMGYIVATYKPAAHRHVITTKWSIITVVSCLFTMITLMGIGYIFDGRRYDPLEAAMVVATDKTLWGLAICCIIGACEYGSVPVVTDILSWHGFVPLSKLSYCLYLLHELIILKQKFATRSSLVYAIHSLSISALGVLALGCVWSLGLHLILEAPLINISNELFTVKSKPLHQNGVERTPNTNGISANQNEENKPKTL